MGVERDKIHQPLVVISGAGPIFFIEQPDQSSGAFL